MKRLFILLVFILSMTLSGQEQRIADSLRPIFEADTLKGVEMLKVLNDLAFNEIANPELALLYSNELIRLAKELEEDRYVYAGYLQKGNSQLNQGDLDLVLEAYQQAIAAAEREGFKIGEATASFSLGFIYDSSGELDKASEYFEKSIAALRDPKALKEEAGKKSLGQALFNTGDFYLRNNFLEKARPHLDEAGEIFDSLDYELGYAYYLGDVGVLNLKLGDPEGAEPKLREAIDMLKTYEDYAAIAEFQAYLAEIYSISGDYDTAHSFGSESMKHARRLKLKEQIIQTSQLLAMIDSLNGNFQEANRHLHTFIQYKDSMDLETVVMTRFEKEKAESALELQSLKQKRQELIIWIVGISALLLIVIALGTFRRYHYMKKTSKIISRERDRAESLLLNILPKQTASELKENGKVKAQRYNAASVLFTDFRNFTKHAEEVDPGLLVKSLDYYFSYFDTLMDKYGLEKIKTVGDAYMCAAGIPFPVEDHARRVVDAALEMLDFVEEAKHQEDAEHIRFDIRIGINSGPVVAGIVGTKKFAYDIWGDTVNIAARMESASVPGKVNVAEHTYQLIKDRYQCQYRGEIEAKNRGKLKMYFVSGKKEPSEKAPKRNEPVLVD
ncbi:adenylate/guanylate cyclase domain-containing protein [Robiginitalea sp. IMCC43444]|uniref:adenylate/guanylate cyclase domain-containing protein n=1 Tax=Robiginitalea sp. IMCC43444 TaxID=3459121 RepID=UPI004042A105